MSKGRTVPLVASVAPAGVAGVAGAISLNLVSELERVGKELREQAGLLAQLDAKRGEAQRRVDGLKGQVDLIGDWLTQIQQAQQDALPAPPPDDE